MLPIFCDYMQVLIIHQMHWIFIMKHENNIYIVFREKLSKNWIGLALVYVLHLSDSPTIL